MAKFLLNQSIALFQGGKNESRSTLGMRIFNLWGCFGFSPNICLTETFFTN
jgi:hypothetical protein